MFELFFNDMHKASYDLPFARNQASAANPEQQRPPRFAFSLPYISPHPVIPTTQCPTNTIHHPLSLRAPCFVASISCTPQRSLSNSSLPPSTLHLLRSHLIYHFPSLYMVRLVTYALPASFARQIRIPQTLSPPRRPPRYPPPTPTPFKR